MDPRFWDCVLYLFWSGETQNFASGLRSRNDLIAHRDLMAFRQTHALDQVPPAWVAVQQLESRIIYPFRSGRTCLPQALLQPNKGFFCFSPEGINLGYI